MKKYVCFLTVILIMQLSNHLYAQVRQGFIGGLNQANMSLKVEELDMEIEKKTSNLLVAAFGGFLDINLFGQTWLHSELMYLQRGGVTTIPESDEKLRFRSSFLELPILFKFEFGQSVQPFITFGPSIGYLLDSKVEMDTDGFRLKKDLKSINNTIHFGFQFGIGISCPIDIFSLFVETRYNMGITDMLKDGILQMNMPSFEIDEDLPVDSIKMKTKGLQFLFGITMTLAP